MATNSYSKNKFITRNTRVGLPPGTLVKHVDAPNTPTTITLYEFNETTFTERDILSIEDAKLALENTSTIKWLDIDGIHQPQDIAAIGKYFNIHPLTQEDIMSTDQRPKFEEYPNYTAATFRMLSYDTSIQSEQLTVLLLPNVVLTFQESNAKDAFNVIRERLRNSKGRVRKMGADYLSYVLIDAVVDTYFGILEKIGERIEFLENEVLISPEPDTMASIHALKRELIYLRKSVWPMRELLSSMQRSDSELYNDSVQLYIRDVYDHTVRLIETIESYHDLLNGLMDLYLSNLSQKTNEVMKILTIISAIFIPITFIAGVYGMNFDHMPELHTVYGYGFALLLMFSVAGGMVYYFKQKKWL
jgi:magnesium transporter